MIFLYMFSPLKIYKIQHQEFKFRVFCSISGHLWALENIFFQFCTRILFTDYVEMRRKCVYTGRFFLQAKNWDRTVLKRVSSYFPFSNSRIIPVFPDLSENSRNFTCKFKLKLRFFMFGHPPKKYSLRDELFCKLLKVKKKSFFPSK